jgi:translation initiation factor 3 subunit L
MAWHPPFRRSAPPFPLLTLRAPSLARASPPPPCVRALSLSQNEVQQQKLMPAIRSYLKLYTTIGISKLAALAEADESTFREHLQCLKHKSHSLACVGGAPLSGQRVSATDVDFFVDGEVAHVADVSLVRQHADYFVKQINKLEEIICSLK